MINQKDNQRRVLLATSLSYVLVLLDTSIVNVALGSIDASVQASASGLQWVMNAYTLTFACLLLTGGALGDRIGAKTLYLAGLVVFAAASLLCGLAPNRTLLIFARVLQGMGAALLVPCSLILINLTYTDANERASVIGNWVGFGGVAMAAGPLVGGVLIHLVGWRCIFWVNVPVALMGVWLIMRVRTATAAVGPIGHLDIKGQVLAITALVTSLSVLIDSAELGWHSPWIISAIIVAGLAWAMFVVTEKKSKDPMLPMELFKNTVFSAGVFVTAVSALVFYGEFFLLSMYFQTLRGWTPLTTGLAFLPMTGCLAIGSFSSGALGHRYGSLHLVVGGFWLYVASFIGLYVVSVNGAYWHVALCFLVLGFAAGVITPAVTATVMNTIDRSRAGVAAGVLNASRQAGSAMGVAIFGALLVDNSGANDGVDIAIGIAIGLSLLASLCWIVARVRPVRRRAFPDR